MSFADSITRVRSKSKCACKGVMHDKGCCEGPTKKTKSSFSAANPESIYTGGIPELKTAEESYTQEDRQSLHAMALHLYRNNGAAYGLVEMLVQHMAASWTPNPSPIRKLLDGWDDEDFDQWSESQVCFHRDYLEGTKFISASEDKNFTGLVQQQVRNTEILGEITATVEYLDYRTAQHRHRELGTAINVFDPTRIYNPVGYVQPNSSNAARVIDGIKKNRYNRTLGAYIHDRPYNDCSMYALFDNKTPLTPMFGRDDLAHRQQFIHCFADQEIGFCRGVSAFAASAEYLVMQMQTLRNITMRAQRQNESTGVYSSKNPNMSAEKVGPRLGLGGGHDMTGKEWQEDPYLSQFADCSEATKRLFFRNHHLKNSKAFEKGNTNGDIFLPEGDTYEQIAHDNSSLAATELFNSLDHGIAAAHSTGKSQLTKEYSGNYTAMRASRLDNIQSLLMKKNCSDDYSNSIYRPVAEEAVEVGMLKLPEKVVKRFNLSTPERRHAYFVQNMRALTAMEWNKPQDRLIDPKKDAEGHALLLEKNLTTFSKSIGELHGKTLNAYLDDDFSDKKKLKAHEIKCEIEGERMRIEMYKAAGMPVPAKTEETETEE